MSTWADPERVAEQRAEWTAGQIRCRAYNNHAWTPHMVTRNPRTGVFTVTQRCSRCRNRRRQMLNRDGFVLTKWRTLYGAGYLLPKGTGRVTEESRAGLRLADLDSVRVIEEEVDEE